MSKVADNLLREPGNAKFRQFKPTNAVIKRDLVDPKGALEYAVAVRRTSFGFGFSFYLFITFLFFPLCCRWVSVPRFDHFKRCVADCEPYANLSQVDHFQPYYTFNKKYMTELCIGAAILHEAIQIAGKEDDEGLKVRVAKAEEEIRIKRVCSPRSENPVFWDSVTNYL